MKLTFLDVEFANAKNKSICQIGITCKDLETGNDVLPNKNIYIDPSDNFDTNCIRIHGITKEKVEGRPGFSEAWKELEEYFEDSIIIGHNVASSDLDALTKNLQRANVTPPSFNYICTYELAKEVIERFAVENYTLETLCKFFNIEISNAHNAFDDTRACEALFFALLNNYNINPKTHIKTYTTHKDFNFNKYIEKSEVQKAIHEFYGNVRGIVIDKIINAKETEYIINWRNKYAEYRHIPEIDDIIACVDEILKDGVITCEEMDTLTKCIFKYLDISATSDETFAIRFLNGVLEGIVADNVVSEEECRQLNKWLYKNISYCHCYPFNEIFSTVNAILEDGVVTDEELELLKNKIDVILSPILDLQSDVNELQNKHVCLSGNFAYGPKAKVEEYIKSKGGMVDSGLVKSTNILIIGDFECSAYAYGNYGTKVVKALNYNKKGAKILIVKEKDIIK